MAFGLGKSGAPVGDGDIIKDSNTAGFVKDVIEASRKVPDLPSPNAIVLSRPLPK